MIAELEHELTEAPPITVTLHGEEYRLAFPMAAVILYRQQTGDNLFQAETWKAIDYTQDPERFLNALWAGVHGARRVGGDYTAADPRDREMLSALVDFSNAGQAAMAIAQALTAYLPKPADDAKENPTPPEIPSP